jgi:hypothetical protein
MQFNGIINTVFASGPTVALIVASVLDNTLEFRGYESDRGSNGSCHSCIVIKVTQSSETRSSISSQSGFTISSQADFSDFK